MRDVLTPETRFNSQDIFAHVILTPITPQVLMNHWPEYVSLAWGTIKVLLVANINNAKLKQKV